MIPGKKVFAFIALMVLPFLSMTQCVTPLSSVTFDSTFTGSGNAYHTFNFPRFNASMGTLVEVRIRAEVTLRYRFQLENRENVTINNYRVRIVRDDEISGSVLQTPITNTQQTNYGPYSLAASDGTAGSGPDYISAGPMYVMNHSVIEESVYNTADFLGSGNISLDYSSGTYSIVFGSVNYNYNGTAEDTVRFTVTYLYCSTWFLAADVSTFTAAKQNELVNLRWTTPNERNNRVYTIEKSSDGRNFQAVANVRAGSGDYQHTYAPAHNETGKLVFRLKQTEADGSIKYSALRVVDLGRKNANEIKLYPNPSNGSFNIMFSNTKRADWEVYIITASGHVLKRYEFNRALVARINLGKEVPKGLYFIKAVNRKNGDQSAQQLFIQ